MAGVWVFRSGVAKLVQNPTEESIDVMDLEVGSSRKVLVFKPTGQIVASYADLEEKLLALGWRRFESISTLAGNGAAHHHHHSQHQQHSRHSSSLQLQLRRLSSPSSSNSSSSSGGGGCIHFHRSPSSPLLISLPSDFRRFSSVHMYDIVLKNRHHFAVRDIPTTQ